MSKPSNPGAQPAGQIPIPRSRRGIRGFFGDVGREMKKVHWPSHQETNRLTGVVLSVCVLLVTILWVMHITFHTLIKALTRGF
jgi:preprotein translocase SecE subunit